MYLSQGSMLLKTILYGLYVSGVAAYSKHETFFEGLNLPDNEYGASVFALLYGYAFPSFVDAFKGSIGLTALGTNNFLNLGQSNPSSRTVIRPNVDTVYGVSIQDLSHEDVVLTIPPMQQGRFYLFAFYDPYGDSYANIGSLNHNKAGDYLVRPSLISGKYGLSFDNCIGYAGCVYAPTLNSLMLARVELRNNSTDLRYVNRYVNQIKVRGTNRHSSLGPALRPRDFTGLSKNRTRQAFELLARLGKRNPPQDPILARTLPWVLRFAGIDTANGLYKKPSNVNLSRVEDTFHEMLKKWFASPKDNVPLNNGWSILNPKILGSYDQGTDLVARSYVASFGYLANVAEQSVYPTPSKELYHLAEDEAYLVTFSGKPPTKLVGFWSLTIYNSKGFLIENPQNIYALGDRSNLTYADGKKVYEGSSNNMTEPHKPFQILIQSSESRPPSNWTSNWLPSPPSGRGFELTFRVYAPLEAALNGKYEYPTFRKHKALHA